MLDPDILEKLVFFTDEEIDNLNGKKEIDQSIFLNNHSTTVDYRKIIHDNSEIYVRKHARFAAYPAHKHNYLELIYVYAGHMIHHIDDSLIEIKEGEMLFLNQNIMHSIDFCDENDIIFNFIIEPEFMEFLSRMVDKSNSVFNFIFDSLYSYENNGEYLLLHFADNNLVKNYVESIITNIYQPKLYNQIELKFLVGLLLSEIMNYPEHIESYHNNSKERLIMSSVYKYIETSYQEGSLSKLSDSLHLPDYTISKIVKKQTGKTFKQLLKKKRLDVAAHLLKTTKLPVCDVLVEAGYENMTYFYDIFKEAFYMTPYQYRLDAK